MNIDDITIGQARELIALLDGAPITAEPLLGRYVIVRCKDAGVHSGVLRSRNGREATLAESRRLWYWRPAKGKWLSAVANHGLHPDSKVSEQVELIALTEDCEVILCTPDAERSIREASSDE